MRERELKMMVPDTFELPDLGDAIAGASLGAAEERVKDDAYFDTADLRLARWGCTLRHRSGDGWTLKIPRPSKGVVLDREEVTIPGDPGLPPVRALNLVSSLTRGVPVEEVAQVHTRRRLRRWSTEQGTPVAELADDLVRGARPDGGVSSFREIEAELAPDSAGRLLGEVIERLTVTKGGTERPVPKVVRVLGPAAEAPPDVAAVPVPPKPTARQVIQAAFASSVARLLLQLPAARLGTDPEGVHQARVAARRMRSDLKTFEPLLDEEWADGLGAELKLLIDVLGAVRDADVLGVALRAVVDRHPSIDRDAAGRVLDELQLQRRRARRRLLRHLNDEQTMQLLDRLVAASNDPPTRARASRPARDVMPKLVRKRWKRLDRAIDALGRRPAPEDLHAVRILAKRVRYAADAVTPAAGKQARRFAADAATIQDALGELNDAAVTGSWLTGCAERLDGSAAFAAGRMCELVAAEARVHNRRWRVAHESMTKRTAWFS
ncbi:CHAD domain-containing protein [Ilumatobacter sp.]|uniref:CYTH and CHAD domain-containing protein n=1 Tax=Ilumatobacter sp. TaxID=1967498 RepID=UPI003AF44D5D